MRKTAFVISLFILSVSLSGCIVVSSNKTQSPNQKSDKTSCIQSPQDKMTMAEIDAARGLHTDPARLEIYQAIAKRPNLSPQVRIHLIEESKRNLHTDSARKQVLLTLVNNHPPVPQDVAPAEPITEQ